MLNSQRRFTVQVFCHGCSSMFSRDEVNSLCEQQVGCHGNCGHRWSIVFYQQEHLIHHSDIRVSLCYIIVYGNNGYCQSQQELSRVLLAHNCKQPLVVKMNITQKKTTLFSLIFLLSHFFTQTRRLQQKERKFLFGSFFKVLFFPFGFQLVSRSSPEESKSSTNFQRFNEKQSFSPFYI